MIPETEIAKMKQRVEKATPEPWLAEADIEHNEFSVMIAADHPTAIARAAYWNEGEQKKYPPEKLCVVFTTCYDQMESTETANIEFVAHAISDIPALLAERSELLSKIEEQERELVRQSNRGTWPQECLQRAFVDGCAFWQFHHNGSTIFGSERDEAAAEAIRRYGVPRPFTSQEVYEGIPELVKKAEVMEKQGVPVVDVPKVGE